MKKILIFTLLGLISCGTAKVSYDYDDTIDFTAYKTYNYYPELKSSLSQLDERRLLVATDSILETKGFTKSKAPDMYVNFKSKTYETPSRNSVGIGIGSGPVVIGGNIPVGMPDQHIQLKVDFVDVKKDELIWQAEIDDVQNSKNTPENREAFFKVILEKAFSKYPPQKKKS